LNVNQQQCIFHVSYSLEDSSVFQFSHLQLVLKR
jgi:hypothetical protein